jgi:hypothetical protein
MDNRVVTPSCRVCVAFQLLDQLTNYDGIWHERYATGAHNNLVLSDFLQSVLSRRALEFVTLERHKRLLILGQFCSAESWCVINLLVSYLMHRHSLHTHVSTTLFHYCEMFVLLFRLILHVSATV